MVVDDTAPHLGEGQPVVPRREALVASSVLDRLEGNAAHATPPQRVVDDRRDLVVVDALLQGAHQSGGNSVSLQGLQCLLPDAAQIGAANAHQRLAFKAVELQVDLEPGPALGEGRDEVRIGGNTQAVGVDHHVPDRPCLRCVNYGEDFGMDGGLAAGQLHQVGFAFAGDQCVEHALDGGQRQMLGPRRRSRPGIRGCSAG